MAETSEQALPPGTGAGRGNGRGDGGAGGTGNAGDDTAAARPLRRAGRRPEVTRQDWIEAGLVELGRNGAGALRLDTLCRRLGITKGSFYWYFDGRDAFMETLLQAWEARDTLALIDQVEAQGGAPLDRLHALFREANSGRVDFRIEQAIRQWGNGNPAIRQMLHRVDNRRIAYMRDLFAQLGSETGLAELQATLLYALIFGEAMIYRRESRESRATRQQAALAAILQIAAMRRD